MDVAFGVAVAAGVAVVVVALAVNDDVYFCCRKREVMELCQIACEKFAAAEKTPYERDNQAAATMIKVRTIDVDNVFLSLNP